MNAVIDSALAEYERKLFWSKAAAEFQSLRNNPEAWKAERGRLCRSSQQQSRRNILTVEIITHEGGMKVTSTVLCHQLRTVAVERMDKRAGAISAATMREVMRRVVLILGAENHR